jgi:selenocysteine lyase/cysteine desulfurase
MPFPVYNCGVTAPAEPPATPRYDLEAARRGVPLLGSAIPMNHCSQAPQTDATRAAAERYLESWNTKGMDWDGWLAEVDAARATFAGLIGASPDEVAVCSSVSEATSAVASALDFSGPRRGVVASGAEFPTVGQVWLAQERRGATVRWAPLSGGMIAAADYEPLLDRSTALVSACHGYYLNGFVQDTAAIAERVHAAGALLFVDAYQTVGARSIEVRALGADFLAAGNLKFLMGVAGIAFLYVRRELIERLHPTLTGWFGRAEPFGFDATLLDWATTARRFDTGTPPLINAYIARAGMDLVREAGPAAIGDWQEQLAAHLIAGGRSRGLTLHGTDDPRRKTASTAFVVRDARAVEVALRARGVLASARGPVLRMAPHYYSTLADVDRALDLLAEAAVEA